MSIQPSTHMALLQLPRPGTGSVNAEEEPKLVQQYRDFRLAALKNDPDVFASSYAEEVGKDDAYWKQRLVNPLATHIIAIAGNENVSSDPKAFYCSEWCGSVAVLGPLATPSANQSPWAKVPSLSFTHPGDKDQQALQEADNRAKQLTYHLSGVYITAPFRRRGFGQAVVQRALDAVREDAQKKGANLFLVGVHVDTFNTKATGLYERFGFKVESEESYPAKHTEGGIGKERRAYLMQFVDHVAVQ